MMMQRMIPLVVLALVTASCGSGEGTSTSTTEPAPPTTLPSSSLRPVDAFAAFALIPLLVDVPAYTGPPTPGSLDGVPWAEFVPEDARSLLAENGFVVVESGYGQFHEAYSHVDLYSRQSLYVTTDAAYHYWHLAFAQALRQTEREALLPVLEQFAIRLRDVTASDASELAGTSLESSARQAADFATLLVALLEMGGPPWSDAVDAELGLIRGHLDIAESPTTGARTDYSLFVPRGHYTRSPELTRYFLAMSALGQVGFLLESADQIGVALALAHAITSDAALTEGWRLLYEPTAFLVGLADDYTPLELAAAADEVAAEWRTSRQLAADPAVVSAITDELRAARPVAIDAELASVRIMGARFVLDSFILDQLVYPYVIERLTASPLDVAAAFGSEWALQRQREAGVVDGHPQYLPQLRKVQALVADRGATEWAGTVYDAWLHAIQPMWAERGSAFPDYMQSPAWTAKSHVTGFGSYAEAKHDTVLYAKQAFAEGGADPAPAEPRHWVEPDPVVYLRLAAVVALLRDGLAVRGLLTESVDTMLGELVGLYDRFARLASDELAGQPISPEDNQWLESIGSRFELLWLLSAEQDDDEFGTTGGFAASPNDVAAVIVDVMSNPSEALEIGTGLIDRIFVLVPDDHGGFQVARGGVYSYYEFWVPRGERLTDEEWRQMLYDGLAPDRPAWAVGHVTGSD
jgi:hypothetical protein